MSVYSVGRGSPAAILKHTWVKESFGDVPQRDPLTCTLILQNMGGPDT